MPLTSMLKRWLLMFVLLALVRAGTAPGISAQGERKVLRAGASVVDITPRTFPVSSNGGMSDRSVGKAHDPLNARGLVLDNGSVRLAIVVSDSCMIPRDIIDDARKKGVALDRDPGREHADVGHPHPHRRHRRRSLPERA